MIHGEQVVTVVSATGARLALFRYLIALPLNRVTGSRSVRHLQVFRGLLLVSDELNLQHPS